MQDLQSGHCQSYSAISFTIGGFILIQAKNFYQNEKIDYFLNKENNVHTGVVCFFTIYANEKNVRACFVFNAIFTSFTLIVIIKLLIKINYMS